MNKEVAIKIANAVGEICLAYKGSKPGITPAGTKVELADILEKMSFDANGNVSFSDTPAITEDNVKKIIADKLSEAIPKLREEVGKTVEKLMSEGKLHDPNAKLAGEAMNKLEKLEAKLEEVTKSVDAKMAEMTKMLPAMVEDQVSYEIGEVEEELTVEIYKAKEVDDDGTVHTYSRAKMPFSKHPDTNSGYDGYVCWDDNTKPDQFVAIAPGTVGKVPIGISAKIPKGYEIQLRPRSGASSKGSMAIFGTIDETYRGVIKANVANLSAEPLMINEGDRICQFVLAKVTHGNWVMKDGDIDTNTDRGTNGFGSSGAK